jgi:hypothetical protein
LRRVRFRAGDVHPDVLVSEPHSVGGRGGTDGRCSKLDWERFLGSAPPRPFDRDQYSNWRWYWDYGGGAMTDLFVHWVDVVHWFTGRGHADARDGDRGARDFEAA